MEFLEMNRPFFRACHEHGLAMPISQWRDNDWIKLLMAAWCMGGEL